MTELTIF